LDSSISPGIKIIKPKSALVNYAECILCLDDRSGLAIPKIHDSEPDGCPEIIINLGGAYQRYCCGKTFTVFGNTIQLVGQKTMSVRIRQHGPCHVILIKLKPCGLYSLFGLDPEKLIDRSISFEGLFAENIDEFLATIDYIEGTEICMSMVEQFFVRPQLVRDCNPLTEKIIQFIKERNGFIRVQDILDTFPITARTLDNHFKKQLGLSPVEYCNIIKVNRFIKNTSREKKSLTESAIECGFYDQSHLIRKFRSIFQESPRKYFKTRNLLSSVNNITFNHY
jgi:AraC-like DNA-binding protein